MQQKQRSEGNTPKAVVLLSTYNGERYLRAQLDSILGQTYENLELYIRDDGSKDGTVEILREYAARHKKIVLISGSGNLGYPACFYALTDMAPDADYYFFSDQDDVWFADKVERAVKRLEQEPAEEPRAYFGGYTVCNSDLQPVGSSPEVKKSPQLKDALFEVCGLEFTMAVNRAGLKLLNENKPSFAQARGTWRCMLYTAFGKVICDNTPCAYYRRHESAVTSAKQSGIGMWIWRIKTFFFGGFAEYGEILRDFDQTMGGRLNNKERRMVHLFANGHYFPDVFVRVFYPKRLRRKLLDELALRLVFFIGKL